MNRPGCLNLYCQTKVHHPPPRSTDWSHSHGPSSKIMTAWGSCPAAHRCSWRDISRIIKPAPVACRGGSPTRPRGLKAIFISQHSLFRSLLDKSHPRPLGLPSSSYLLHSSWPHPAPAYPLYLFASYPPYLECYLIQVCQHVHVPDFWHYHALLRCSS